MFFGEFEHSLDSKGRLIIPARYRESLGEKCYIMKGVDKCLNIYPEEEWIKLRDKLYEIPSGKGDARQLVRQIFASTDELTFDKQGRVQISVKHRGFAGLEKDVILAGVGKKIEVWSKEEWDAVNNIGSDDMVAIAERLSELGIDF